VRSADCCSCLGGRGIQLVVEVIVSGWTTDEEQLLEVRPPSPNDPETSLPYVLKIGDGKLREPPVKDQRFFAPYQR
jgi:hypothetical protein